MKEWFNGLEQREQRLVGIMMIVVLIAGVYFLMIKPLQERIERAEKKLVTEQKLLTWVENNAATIIRLRASTGTSTQSNGSLDQLINRSARQHNIIINRLQPQNSKMQVMIDQAPFNQILEWVQTLQLDYGLTIEIADFRKGKESGLVKVRIVVSQ